MDDKKKQEKREEKEGKAGERFSSYRLVNMTVLAVAALLGLVTWLVYHFSGDVSNGLFLLLLKVTYVVMAISFVMNLIWVVRVLLADASPWQIFLGVLTALYLFLSVNALTLGWYPLFIDASQLNFLEAYPWALLSTKIGGVIGLILLLLQFIDYIIYRNKIVNIRREEEARKEAVEEYKKELSQKAQSQPASYASAHPEGAGTAGETASPTAAEGDTRSSLPENEAGKDEPGRQGQPNEETPSSADDNKF